MAIMSEHPSILQGDCYIDERGEIRFINDFNFNDVRRFYFIHHHSDKIVRAWQGHKQEKKYFVVVQGLFLICAVKINDWEHPDPDLSVEKFVLSVRKTQLLSIPPGYANGFRALAPDSTLLVFSDKNLSESQKDIYRFDQKLWYAWNT